MPPFCRARVVSTLCLLALLPASPAAADATLFLGSAMTPAKHVARGFAVGMGLLVVGFEFEFSDAREVLDESIPGLRTGMGNVYVQTPIPLGGLQFYATTGAGLYRERLGEQQETHVGLNSGGGVKVSLAGPLRARIDYRVFNLRGEPLHATVHRLYAGLNLAF
jgi:hypothetical protein